MADILMGELIILVLLILTCIRIFFSGKINTDSLSVLSIVAFILTVLQIYAYGAKLPEVVLLVLSLFCILTNIHAMGRLSSHLIVDRYRIGFVISSFIILVFSVALSVLLIYYRPVPIDKNNFGVTKSVDLFRGSFKQGFTGPAAFYEKKDCILYTFTPQDKIAFKDTTDNPIILFLPDRKTDVTGYMPYLFLLSKEGFIVMTADFFPKDEKWINSFLDSRIFRPTAMLLYYIFYRDAYNSEEQNFFNNMEMEYEALLNTAKSKYPGNNNFMLVSDGMGKNGAEKIFYKNQNICTGCFDLSTVPDFKYSGFGCVEQTDIFLAKYLGLKRDKTYFIPRYLALETKNYAALRKNFIRQ